MSVVLGAGAHRYEVVEGWPTLPAEVRLGEVAGVAVDDRDRVYLFNRGPHPMVVVDRDGRFLQSWGHDLFRRPHGVHVAADGAIYCTDEGTHTVAKCTLDGRLLLRLGIPDRPAPAMSGRPFHRCTHTALAPDGAIYVTDGYGNAAVHKFAADGRYLFSWGQPGCDLGEFNLPHNVLCDPEGWVYVADRENHRIQIFDGDGHYETQWNNLHRPSALCALPGSCCSCAVGEIGPYLPVNRDTPNLGPRISFLVDGTRTGKLDSQGGPGNGPGQFASPHGLAVDSLGDLYVGEVTASAWPSLFPGRPLPDDLRSIKKLKRLPAVER